jgi:CheY-like chemotaxis protein
MRKMIDSIVSYKTISVFENGKLAIDGINAMISNQEDIPEVIFLDINMPVMDGWQFLEEFIALPIENKIQINIFTSSIDTRDEQNWIDYKNKTHHTVTYNHKPLNADKILEIIEVV